MVQAFPAINSSGRGHDHGLRLSLTQARHSRAYLMLLLWGHWLCIPLTCTFSQMHMQGCQLNSLDDELSCSIANLYLIRDLAQRA